MQGYSARQLSVSRQRQRVLHAVNLEVCSGELHVLLGPNGAGKSSLLRTLAGEWPQSEGVLLLDGLALAAMPALQQARRRAVLPQQDGLIFGLRVHELIALGRYAAKDQTASTTDAVLAEVMLATQISALAERRYPSLSGGEQRRVQLARVLAQVWDVPQAILLLDEPTHSLDPAHQHAVLALLQSLAVVKGFAILASLHDLNLASAYAHRISLLKAGRVVATGAAAQVLNSAALQNIYGDSLQFTAIEHAGQRQWITRSV